jgi:calcineurin-like phosphoesterase family protein
MNIQTDIIDKLTPEIISEMESIWFTADLHAGHPKIVDICNRPVSKEDHDEWLIREVFNKYVQRKDEVYLLGDITFAKRKDAQKWVARLNGNKYLILGNHDKNIRNLGNWSEVTQIKDFTFSRKDPNINIHIVLCHYCLLTYNRQIHGSWHLFGHSHCRPLEGQPNLSFDIGIDRIGIWRPYNLYEICKIMNMKEQNYDEDTIIKSL